MSQNDMTIDNSTGANVRADINSALQAIATNNSGSSAPSTTFASQFFADTNAGIMKLRNTSNNDYVNLFTLAGGIDVDAASNFNEDVTFTGATSGRNVVFDKSIDSFVFADNAKAIFGASNDLQIYHQGSHSYIQDAGTGSLILVGSGVVMQNAAQTENMFAATENSSIALYFDNSLKAETLTTGFHVLGTFESDNFKVSNPGNNAVLIQNPASGIMGFGTNNQTNQLVINAGGNVGIPTDGAELRFGASDDLKLSHDGTHSNLINDTGEFKIRGNDIRLQVNAGNENYIRCTQNSEVQLYFDNSEKLNTHTGGAHVHGAISSTPSSSSTRGANFNSYVVDQSAAAQSVATVKAQSNMGVVMNLNRFYTSGNILEFRINNDFEGAVTVAPTGVGYTTTSDYRIKENVVALSDGITKLKQLKPYRFNFIAEPSVLHDGFFAHEVTPVVPTAVSGEKDATEIRYYEEGDTIPSGKVIGDIKDENSVVAQGLDYSKIVPLITAALQESIAKIEVLETKVAALEAA